MLVPFEINTMKLFFPYFFTGCVLLFFVPTLTAQQMRFYADADAQKIVKNGYVQVEFILENGNGNNFSPPSFEDWQVISGPNRASSMRIVNGRVSQKISYQYTLRPKRLGNLVVGGASIRVGTEKLSTAPLKVTVVEGKNPALNREGGASAEVYVRAEVEPTEAYVGQQILVDYKLYTTINVESYNVTNESEYPGFYAQEVKRFSSAPRREVIDGQQFTTKIIKRMALFPQQTGQVTIEPLDLMLGIAKDDPRRRNSFFFTPSIERVPVATEPLAISGNPLPSGAPESFTGAVGKFGVRWMIQNNQLTTDDIATIRLVIEGTGDPKRIQPPALNLPVDSFEVYDPKITEERSEERQGQIFSRRIFEYLVVPRVPMQYSVMPAFSFFDPDSVAYVVSRPDLPFRFRVARGSGAARTAPATDASVVTEDIRYIKTETSLRSRSNTFFGAPLFWMFATVPLFVLGGVVLYRRRLHTLAGMDASVIKNKRAAKVARKRLEHAKTLMEEKKNRDFYNEISRALLGYAGDKLNLPTAEMTKPHIRQQLEAKGAQTVQTQQFVEILQLCETALYAGKDNAESVRTTYDQSISLLTELEQQLTTSIVS